LWISDKTAKKLKEKHNVSKQEVQECFVSRLKAPLIDDREEHRTNPPTQWFISTTKTGRLLKVVFILLNARDLAIRTAYEPNAEEIEIFEHTT
jgi:uncharacterized DUF497 family protein